MGLRAGGPGRFGTTGLTLGDSGAFGLAPPNRGGAPTPGRFGTTGASISISVSKSGSSSIAASGVLASSATVGSNAAGGGMSSGETSSCNDGAGGASSWISPNSALVVSNPSSMPPAVLGSNPSTRLVVSISSEVSGSAMTGSIRLSTTGSGSSAGLGGSLGGGGTRPVSGGLPAGGASTSRNTRLDVFRLPDFDGSSGGCGLGAAGAAGAAAPPPGRRSGSPYIRR